ncbi:hypothetical protein GYMLUDRAFT_244804 [Collybiopsis luxurians FD-317 M1]|uniref:Unplaced genomic scaffold GYMLUscaffold_29, whole genome shotgun sequence n=1 Tax=Collybiopsis luxurians FD-317 M1 TaxID=944289 RepID=A0A0D0BWQ5_9AGAR|nr:hypothetical protein GYMLUDRAFT_244804 [Collybiopsis luxurians FD-317 M1]
MRHDSELIGGGIIKMIMRDGKYSQLNPKFANVSSGLGTMYFGIIAIINSINMVLWEVGSSLTRGMFSYVTAVVSSVMMSHLMFNLRERDSSRIWLVQTESTISEH